MYKKQWTETRVIVHIQSICIYTCTCRWDEDTYIPLNAWVFPFTFPFYFGYLIIID